MEKKISAKHLQKEKVSELIADTSVLIEKNDDLER